MTTAKLEAVHVKAGHLEADHHSEDGQEDENNVPS
jgi:hypothetical protein